MSMSSINPMSLEHMATDAYRAKHNPMMALKRSPATLPKKKRGSDSPSKRWICQKEPRTGDCNTCSWNKNMNSKIKGKRIPGSFGKCTNPNGPCDNPVPRRGIRDLKTFKSTASTWKPKGKEG